MKMTAMHETERARRVATVAEVEVVRCITSRSDQTGKYFSYNFGVVFSLLSFFSCLLFSSLLVCSLLFSSSPLFFTSVFIFPRGPRQAVCRGAAKSKAQKWLMRTDDVRLSRFVRVLHVYGYRARHTFPLSAAT